MGLYEAGNQLGQFEFNMVTDRDRCVVFVPAAAWESKEGTVVDEYVDGVLQARYVPAGESELKIVS